MLRTELWKHQKLMLDWWIGKRSGIWAAEMGTGKTLAALAGIFDFGYHYNLVVTVKAALPVWKKEIEQHTYMNGVILDKGTVAQRTQQMKTVLSAYPQGQLVFVINYEALIREPMLSFLLNNTPSVIVCDESHKIASYKSKISKTLYQIGKKAVCKLAMTGTPFPNKPTNIFGQIRFTNEGVFGRAWTHFRRRYEILVPLPGVAGIYMTQGFQNMDEFTEKLKPEMLQIKADDVLVLPEPRDIDLPVVPSSKGINAYKKFRKELVLEYGQGILTADNSLVKSLRLQQLSGGFAGAELVDSSKVETLVEYAIGLGDRPFVVFAQFLPEIRAIRDQLGRAGIETSEYTGVYDEFEVWSNGETQAIVCQYQKGSMGVDMTRARHVFYFSPTYRLDLYDQSRARIRRPGATPDKPVYYYHLYTEGTLDMGVYRALRNKESINDAVLKEITRGV